MAARRRLRLLTLVGLIGLAGRPATAEPETTPPAGQPAPPTWRFRHPDRPVKVISLAGSVGAFHGQSYSRRLATMCSKVEIKNLSKTNLGVRAMKQRFREQVLANRRINFRAEGTEFWLLFAGGLNSIAMPESSSRYSMELFMLAHRRGIKVVALTPTPWGDESDRRRWAGTAGIRYRRMTQKFVDFLMGRLSPREALGRHASSRKGGVDARWQPEELPDVAVDLYDSALRTRDAPPRDITQMRAALRKDKAWSRRHRKLAEAEREAALEADAKYAAEIPRWYLREELRSFDHTHPNVEGHRRMAEIACPRLPASWACSCPDSPR